MFHKELMLSRALPLHLILQDAPSRSSSFVSPEYIPSLRLRLFVRFSLLNKQIHSLSALTSYPIVRSSPSASLGLALKSIHL